MAMKFFLTMLMAVVPCLAGSPEVDKAKALGSPMAPVQIEVFASFDCPHCKILHEQTVPLLMRDYVTKGKIYLVNREFPLSGQYHPYAREAANYATAAGRVGKYQQVSEALFAHQAEWAVNGKVWDTVAAVLTPAEQKKVLALAKDPGVLAEVQQEYDEGVAAGISGTPTIIVTHGTRRYPIPSQQLEYSLLKSMLDGMTK
jgi:protein-disulfide isomerase